MSVRSNSEAVSSLVPGAALVRAAIPLHIVGQFASRINDGMAVVSRESGVPIEDIDRLTTAWDHRCHFVKQGAFAIRTELCEVFPILGELGADVHKPIDATLFVATHHCSAGTHAHQDVAYKWNKSKHLRYALTTWVTLDACDEESGALIFSSNLPRERVEPRQDFLRADFLDGAMTAQWHDGQVVAKVDRGDVVVFDARVWHAAASFTHPGRRRALAIRWASKSGWERGLDLPGPIANSETFGMDTSGVLLCTALTAAFPAICSSAGTDGVYDMVSRLLRCHPALVAKLGSKARQSLGDLKVALGLMEHHRARPSADVWRGVRDHAIPALNEVIGKEAMDGLA